MKLRSTSFETLPLQPSGNIAHGYALSGSDFAALSGEPRDVTGASLSGTWASAAIVSSADDLATFYSALFAGKLLPQSLLGVMQRTVPTDDPHERAGLGIFRYSTPCGYAWGHGGTTVGYTASALSNKDGTHVAVVAANAFAPAFAPTVAQTARTAYCRS